MVAIHPCFAVVPSFWQSSSDIQFQSAYQTFSPRHRGQRTQSEVLERRARDIFFIKIKKVRQPHDRSWHITAAANRGGSRDSQGGSGRSAHSPFSSLKDIKGNLPAKSTGPVKPAKQKSSLKSSGAAGGGNEGGKLQGKKNGTSSNGGKASSTANGSASSQSSPSPAPRITSNVGHNLKVMKMFKDMRAARAEGQKTATSYRRKKEPKLTPEEEFGADYNERTLALYNGGGGLGPPPVLFIDGYNVCGSGAWPKLKKPFMQGDLKEARSRLVESVSSFAHIHGVKVVVVFDAMRSCGVNNKETWNGVDVVYTCSEDADSYIEREVKVLKDGGCSRVWVVTQDEALRVTVFGSGGCVWTPTNLVAELKAAQKELEELMKPKDPYSTVGKHLEYNIDEATRNQLLELRRQLSREEYGL